MIQGWVSVIWRMIRILLCNTLDSKRDPSDRSRYSVPEPGLNAFMGSEAIRSTGKHSKRDNARLLDDQAIALDETELQAEKAELIISLSMFV